MSDLSCNLLALGNELEAHLANWKQLLALVITSQELTEGYALELPASTENIVNAAKFIALERLCCPWHGSSLEVEPDPQLGLASPSFWLRMTGPQELKAMFEAELAKL
jgi:hypothetical protein